MNSKITWLKPVPKPVEKQMTSAQADMLATVVTITCIVGTISFFAMAIGVTAVVRGWYGGESFVLSACIAFSSCLGLGGWSFVKLWKYHGN